MIHSPTKRGRFFLANNLTKRQIMTKRAFLSAALVGAFLVVGTLLHASGLLANLPLNQYRGDPTNPTNPNKPSKPAGHVRRSEGEPSSSVRVAARKIEQQNHYRLQRFFTGVIEATRESRLSFERAGKVTELLVDEGEYVEEGTLLASLDNRHLLIEKARVIAQLEQAKSVLAELESGPRVEQIDAARANMEDLKAQWNLQQKRLARSEKLWNTNAISVDEYEQAVFQTQASQARYQSANAVLTELLKGTRAERVAAQSASVDQLSATLDDIDLSLRDCQLTAPFAGAITERMVDQGTVANAATPIFQLTETGDLQIEVGLPSHLSKRVEIGETLMAVSNESNLNPVKFPVRVSSIVAQLDRTTRTRKVILKLPPVENSRRVPGEIVRVAVDDRVDQSGFWLPLDSLVRGPRGLWACFAVETSGSVRGKIFRRQVEVLHQEGERVFVSGTLQSGDAIITQGASRAVDGLSVEFTWEGEAS